MISIKTFLQTSLFLAIGFFACNNSSDNAVSQTPENGVPETDTQTTVVSSDANSAKQLPSFIMMNQAGGQTDLSSFQGKKVLFPIKLENFI